jgi:hypothetical protein
MDKEYTNEEFNAIINVGNLGQHHDTITKAQLWEAAASPVINKSAYAMYTWINNHCTIKYSHGIAQVQVVGETVFIHFNFDKDKFIIHVDDDYDVIVTM